MERTTSGEGFVTHRHPPLRRAMRFKNGSVKRLSGNAKFFCSFVTYLQQLNDSPPEAVATRPRASHTFQNFAVSPSG
jgi:hypothetical protein